MKTHLLRPWAGLLAALALLPTVPAQSVAPSKDIVGVAVSAGSFNTLVAAVKAAGLVETLQGKGPFTVFAPTDEAFAKLPPGTVESLLKPENKQQLVAILTYHVVPARVLAADVRSGPAKTVQGESLNLKVDGGKVTVNNATVVAADVAASNGVIHVIDQVVLPNAVQTVVQVAASTGTFNTLVAAVKAAGLVETLQGKGPFTVFAPTDEAFAKLPPGTVESLLKPENKQQLVAILTYHVVPARVLAADVRSGPAKTVQGESLNLKVDGGKVTVNNATVIKADVPASNGVIHVIDSVLLPN